MTLKEAIETIESIKHVCRTLFPPKEQAALSLGIEALNVILKCRNSLDDDFLFDLPGETKK